MLTKVKIITRVWKAPGPTSRMIKRTSYGYSVRLNGKQERKVDATWSKDDALAELRKRLDDAQAGRTALEAHTPWLPPSISRTRGMKGSGR